MEKIYIDAEKAVAGRVGSFAAKQILKGNEVIIFNCEKAVISGNKQDIVEKIKKKRRMGRGASLKGPKISKTPEKFMKRIIRGMLPWDRQRGRDVFRKLKCIEGDDICEESKKQAVKMQEKPHGKHFTIKQISELI